MGTAALGREAWAGVGLPSSCASYAGSGIAAGQRGCGVHDQPGLNDVTEPDNSRSRAWRLFFEVTGRLQGVLESRLKRGAGMSLADYNILMALWDAPGHSLRMGELAERVDYSPSRLSYLVSGLRDRGHVRKIPSPHDKRGYVAVLTETGERAVLHATRIHQDTVREYFLDDLSDRGIEQIVSAFSELERKDAEQR